MTIACACGIVIGFVGCSALGHEKAPGLSLGTSEARESLTIGMSSEEVLELFGEPNAEYVTTFGQDVGQPWVGRVWVYYSNHDERLRFVDRRRKDVLVFYPAGGNMRLNHWLFETEEEPADSLAEFE